MKMPSSTLVAALTLAGVIGFSACERQEETGEMTEPIDEPGLVEEPGLTEEPAVEEFDIESLEGSEVSGTARVIPQGDQLDVVVRLEGAPETEQFAAHIHKGACGNDLGVAVPLGEFTVLEGALESTTTIDASQLPASETGYFIQAHSAEGRAVACGNVSGLETGMTDPSEAKTGETDQYAE